MPEVLSVGTSGLLSLQRALATTSNNIVNAGVEGYSRQTVNFQSLPTQRQGNSFVGSGVTIGSIERSYSEFLVSQAREIGSSFASHSARSQMLARLDNMLTDGENNVSNSIQNFFNALHDLSANPSGTPEREVAIAQANSLTDQVHSVDTGLKRLAEEVNDRLTLLVSEVNNLATSLGQINAKLAQLSGAGSSPNDLLDQRDLILTELASHMGISTIEEQDGSINVLVGNGQALVTGSRAFALNVQQNVYDGTQLEVTYEPSPGVSVEITDQLHRGEVGGLIDFRERSLNPARNSLGLLVTGMVETFNAGHQLGFDLNGNLGGNFFEPTIPTVLPPGTNQGSAAIAVTIDDVSDLQASDYRIRYDGAQWSVIRESDDTLTTGPGPFSLDGMTINITGVPVAGDSFELQPTRRSAEVFEASIQRPEEIAAALPLRPLSAVGNFGDAAISDLSVSSQSGLPLGGDVVLTFDPDAMGVGVPGFTVTGSVVTAVAYDPGVDSTGTDLSIPDAGGLVITVTGIPQSGDQLRIENNTNGVGDNRNMLALVELQSNRLLDQGNSTYLDTYGNLVARVGIQTRQADASTATEGSLLSQAVSARESVSGVNLEEEAANLLRYQQAYQAAAQVVAVAGAMFDALLGAAAR